MEILKTLLLSLNDPFIAPYVICVLGLGVAGLSLYVVLAVLKHGTKGRK